MYSHTWRDITFAKTESETTMESQKDGSDVWEVGSAYEVFIGRWSRLIAKEFLQWLSITPGSRWVDVGCGTGMLSKTILAIADPLEVKGVDPSPGFIAFARNHIHDPHATFDVGTAESLPLESHACDVAVSGLVLNFVPQKEKAIAEMRRVVRTDGVVAAYVWDYAGQMQYLRRFWDAATAMDPAAMDRDEAQRFPICNPGPLKSLFVSQGLREIHGKAIDVSTHFTDFDDFWSPFLAGQGPAPGYVASLNPGQRLTLRERLRSALPIAADGTIDLIARAWAIRGYS